MEKPWLVQRCEISDDKLQYDYMGSSEFEFGACPASLKRIFAQGLSCSSTTVRHDGKEVSVYVVGANGFNVLEYQPYLQQMVDNTLRLKERSEFDEAIKQQLGIRLSWDRRIRNNAWFDIENDVLWTLTEENQRNLVSRLELIKQRWATKKTIKT